MAATRTAAAGPGGPRRLLKRIAARRDGWERLEELAGRARRRGLSSLSAEELRELGRLYRQATSDLAYVRSALPGSEAARDLNALVARAHNVVYQGESVGLRDVLHFFRVEVPRTFRRNLGYFLISTALMVAPALVAFAVISIRPDLIEPLMPPGFVEEYLETGRLWTETLNVMPHSISSAAIFTNNIFVTILAFALGFFFGAGTVYLLVMNGIHIGAIFAACAQYDLADDLGTFVVAHGIAELSCVFVAGAAGLMLGDALLNPGELSRADALRLRGEEAVRLVLGMAPVLVLAGIVEGYVSPDPTLPATFKAWLGVAFGAVLYLWLFGSGRGGTKRPQATAAAR
jgi:uncharacterized membrane protein SpoIIM required for sporulation